MGRWILIYWLITGYTGGFHRILGCHGHWILDNGFYRMISDCKKWSWLVPDLRFLLDIEHEQFFWNIGFRLISNQSTSKTKLHLNEMLTSAETLDLNRSVFTAKIVAVHPRYTYYCWWGKVVLLSSETGAWFFIDRDQTSCKKYISETLFQ